MPVPTAKLVPEGSPAPTGAAEIDRVKARLNLLLRSGYSAVAMMSSEEDRCCDIIEEVAAKLSRKVYVWSMTDGWRWRGDIIDVRSEALLVEGKDDDDRRRMQAPIDALDAVMKNAWGRRLILFLKDIGNYFDEQKVVRKLADLMQMKQPWTVVFVVQKPGMPALLEKDVALVDVPLPDAAELEGLLLSRLRAAAELAGTFVTVRKELVGEVVRNSLGLTRGQALHVFNMAIANDSRLTIEDLKVIAEQKRQVIAKTGLLEYCVHNESLKSVGGLDNLKAWLDQRTEAFSEKARAYGLPQPRGLLLLGVQGCGKSLLAKATSAFWSIPLLRLDVGALFSSYIGKTEENVRNALRVAESIAPVVLWIDEIEKAFSGLESSGQTDAGTTARLFASFLTWMQEKSLPVFVVATANSIDRLPPELLRKGRFDEIFFVDLPVAAERAEIFRIHLAKRRRDPAKFDVPGLVGCSEGFSGAEIEQAIVSAMYHAFPAGREFTTEDVCRALGETVPLSATMQEKVQALREWARPRARWATPAAAKPPA
ncbi:MAG TPA: AAA family ATPase [Planctomycetota bacterium]|nr:AAA family ATPase [Planctomycetota bacterium]